MKLILSYSKCNCFYEVFQLLGLAKMSHCRINPLSLPLEVMRMLFGVEHTHETCQIWWNMKANQVNILKENLLVFSVISKEVWRVANRSVIDILSVPWTLAAWIVTSIYCWKLGKISMCFVTILMSVLHIYICTTNWGLPFVLQIYDFGL
jgi:hypothetical protein